MIPSAENLSYGQKTFCFGVLKGYF